MTAAPESTAIPTVLVLTAGRGSRYAAGGGQGSKCLAPVRESTPLLWTLEILAAVGASDVVLMTGFAAHLVQSAVQARRYPAKLTFMRNPIWHITDSAYSFGLAAARITGPVILTYGDVLLTESLLRRVLQEGDRDVVALDNTRDADTWDMHAYVSGGRVSYLTKRPTANIGSGESACLFRLMDSTRALLAAAGTTAANRCKSFEVLLSQHLADIHAIPVWCEPSEWCEIDFPHDIARAGDLIHRHAKSNHVSATRSTP